MKNNSKKLFTLHSSLFTFRSSLFALRSSTGQLLIESMISIGIMVVGLLGILGLLSRSTSLNRVVSHQFIGNYLASEGIEITKNLIDADWMKDGVWNNDFVKSSGSFEVEYNMIGENLENKKISSSFCDPDPQNNANCSTKPLLISNDGFYGYSGPTQSSFYRTVNIDFFSSEEIKVNSIVKWTTRGGGQFEVNLEDHFFNWRP